MNDTKIRGLMVRVGIDSSCGEWNAPVHLPTGEFAYVPIPESKPLHPGMKRSFDECDAPLSSLGTQLPAQWKGEAAHLDPDFEFLTYGDQGARGQRIREVFGAGATGFIAFYAALRDIKSGELIDALIGCYEVADVIEASVVPASRWRQNAHTRRRSNKGDVIVLGKAGKSGRFARCIVIGRYRDRAHRVDKAILKAWGGLSVRDGYIQRSVRLPEFVQPARFLKWLQAQKPKLLAANNLPPSPS